MTTDIALVLAILVAAIILFVTERIRVDLVALLVLGALAVLGLVTPQQALSGFSNPAVVTVWAMFVVSAGLSYTGIAGWIGRQVLRLAGKGEARLVGVIMLTAGVMSAVMNNIGVAALLLPVVMDISRRTKHAPSRLLIPLAFGSLLGGLTTLIGTPPNILVSDVLFEYGFRPFDLFDFTPLGGLIMIFGTLFMMLVGRKLLPVSNPEKEFADPEKADLGQTYGLGERMFAVRVERDSSLAGKTLAASRLGSALGFNVIGLVRNGRTRLSPDPGTVFEPGDRIIVIGAPEKLQSLGNYGKLLLEGYGFEPSQLVSSEIEVAQIGLSPESPLIGKTLRESNFRGWYGLNVLSIERDGARRRTHLQNVTLQRDDILLVQGPRHQIEAIRDQPGFLVSNIDVAEVSHLSDRLLVVRITEDSPLQGKTLAESHLGDAIGLSVLGIAREGVSHLAPAPNETLQAGDMLLVEGDPDELKEISSFHSLAIEQEGIADVSKLETEQFGLAEAVLSPHTSLVGKSLRQIHFREKYGINVVAIWREGRAYRSNLGDLPLRFGDALLLYGSRERMNFLGREPDFLVLYEKAQARPRLEKAPRATIIMGLILLPVLLGWMPISIAAVIGAAFMVLTGCLSMEEAYRSIEWKAVFLIAGMLPLGIAMEQSGAARFLADGMIALVGGFGPLALIAGLFILTAATTQTMPSPAVVVFLAPIAMNTAQDMGISPYALMMAVAIAASASFLSPVAHPSNLLVLGPGGYRFRDYLRVGIPLTLVVLLMTLLLLPIFWPL